MAALILGAAGAAVGAATGLPFGASLGWTAGAMLGNALFPPSLPDIPPQFGPRLGDLKVQTSTYGNAIPRVYGTARIAGNVIWSTDIVETATTTTTSTGGGKGGGGEQTQTQTTYSYSVSLAVALCEGPITGIRKVWANGKLIYNVAADADAMTVLGSTSAMTVYTGDEDQQPSALMESYLGAGNVPGYRGTAFVEFANFQLAEFGNRTPNFEFEVVASGTAAIQVRDPFVEGTSGHSISVGYNDSVLACAPLHGDIWYRSASPDTLHLYDVINASEVVSVLLDAAHFTGGSTVNSTPGGIDAENRALLYDVNNGTIYRVNRDGMIEYFTPSITGGSRGIVADSDGLSFWVAEDSTGYVYKYTNVDWAAHTCDTTQLPGFLAIERFTTNGAALSGYVYAINGVNLYIINSRAMSYTTVNVSANDGHSVMDASGNLYVLCTGNTVKKLDSSGALVASAVVATLGDAIFYDTAGYVWVKAGTASADYYKLDAADLTTSGIIVENETGIVGEISAGTLISFKASPYGTLRLIDARATITPGAAALDDVVTDICALAGLTSADIDVTDLAADTVDGYVITARGPVRGMLEPLMSAYFFDAVESDDKIKFVKRGGASLATIPVDDLAARVDGTYDTPESFQFVRQQETELPVEINVAYMARENNYQVSQQGARRLVSRSAAQLSVSYPIVMSDDYARQVADALMFSAWQERMTATFSTSREYEKYEPTDPLTITTANASQTVRITKKNETGAGVINWSCVLEDATVYTQPSTGGASTAQNDTIAPLWNTAWTPLDAPLLRDADDVPGFYFAASGINSNWHGMQLYRSVDAGVTYSAVDGAGLIVGSTRGRALTALATYSATRNEQFDEGNAVSVKLDNGEIESITRAQVLNGGNYAMLGSECIQFRTATLTATDTYTLTGLLRGRLGTEWAMDAHAINEPFVLLTGNMGNVEQSLANLNRAYLYKPVTAGRTVTQTPSQAFTNTGVRLKPLAPVHLAGGINSGADWLLSWKRRTRLSASMSDNVDAPLGEDSEAYEIDVMNGSTVVRTLTSSTASVTYTAAQQTTDFGSTQGTLTINVYQMSARVGRGYVATGTF